MDANKTPYQATDTQIADWKNKHGDVYQVDSEGKRCYLKKPDRATLSAAASIGKADPIKYSEVMLENCWLAGDEVLRSDDEYFFAVAAQLSQLIKVKEATLKKL